MNHVATDQEGDTQTALFAGDSLQLIHRCRINLVDHRTDLSRPQVCTEGVNHIMRGPFHLVQLADLFLDRHLAQQVTDTGLDAVLAVPGFDCLCFGHDGSLVFGVGQPQR